MAFYTEPNQLGKSGKKGGQLQVFGLHGWSHIPGYLGIYEYLNRINARFGWLKTFFSLHRTIWAFFIGYSKYLWINVTHQRYTLLLVCSMYLLARHNSGFSLWDVWVSKPLTMSAEDICNSTLASSLTINPWLKQVQKLAENDSIDGTPWKFILHLNSKIKFYVFAAFNTAPSTDAKFFYYLFKKEELYQQTEI